MQATHRLDLVLKLNPSNVVSCNSLNTVSVFSQVLRTDDEHSKVEVFFNTQLDRLKSYECQWELGILNFYTAKSRIFLF